MKKLFDGVYMLEGEIGGRALQLMYLKGETASMLMDSGCAHDPLKFIGPQITQAGGDPTNLTWILNTHPDLDHVCGNHEMKKLSPRAILACGDADRHICEGIDALMRYRYDAYREDHKICYEGDVLAWIHSEGGEVEPIDVTFRGGEHIRLGSGWELELIAVPGHAEGHLAVYDPLHQALYGADAIHGRGNPGLAGGMKLCPTYENVDQYLATIDRIEHLPITTYVGCHWPVKHGAEVAEFCRESRDFVQTVERLLLDQLTTPGTVRELCAILGPKLGDWPRETDLELVYVLNGHLRRMCERGVVSSQIRRNAQPVREYVRSSTAEGAEK